MADVTWQVELTRDSVQTLQHELEWALQRQNRRFAKRMRGRGGRSRLKLAAAIAVLGIAAVVYSYAADPRYVTAHPWFYIAVLAVFVGGLALVVTRLRRPELDDQHHGVGAMLSRQAAGIYKKPAQQAPYTIDYTLADGHVRAVAPALKLDRSFDLRKAKLVLHSAHALFVFRFGWSFQPMRYIYTSAEAERAALLAVLDAAQVEHAAITGPVEGYVAPIPTAVTRT